MAKSSFPNGFVSERIAYGLLICALGCIWLAVEVGWLRSNLPLGPLATIVIGIVFFLPWLKKR
ncbi:MAG: hypothetical protein QXN37_00715 [Candidatus Anstonellaceae archaeon]